IIGRYAEVLPCESEDAASTEHPECDLGLNSWNSRDFPTPGSATAATICPSPDFANSSARFRSPSSRSRPTNFVSPRRSATSNRVLSGPIPVTSNTSTAPLTPLTLVGPSRLSVKYHSQSLAVDSAAAIEPTGASVCIREARLLVWPIGVYSVCPSPVAIERTTTSPVFTPTRASSDRLPASRNREEYFFSSSCIRSAAYSARCG